MSELDVLIEGELIGRVRMNKAGRLSFDYEPRWRDSQDGYSLSVRMPIASMTYSHNLVSSYLWKLLPENPTILQRWEQQFHVSAANPFKLLEFVGADVAGAVQFFPPAQLATIQSQQRPLIDWISVDELAQRLAQLRADAAAVRRAGDPGRMSLAGAQAKTAFCWDARGKRWGVPSGRAPTTHIIKPAVPGFDRWQTGLITGSSRSSPLCSSSTSKFAALRSTQHRRSAAARARATLPTSTSLIAITLRSRSVGDAILQSSWPSNIP